MSGKSLVGSTTFWSFVIMFINFALSWRGYSQLSVEGMSMDLAAMSQAGVALGALFMGVRGRWRKEIKPITSVLPTKA